jgi:FkbM family methyltransferase
MIILDQFGHRVNIAIMEKIEQDLAAQYVEENDVVLELGARYGSVSCVINSKLTCKTNQVVVEPDERVWGALEKNKRANKCEFHIVKGFVSSKQLRLTNLDDYCGGYGSTAVEDTSSTIPSFTLESILRTYGLQFNVLIADCEGYLEQFFDENPTFYDGLRLIIFEADYLEKCNYDKIRTTLTEKGFSNLLKGYQNVWKK